MTALKITTRSSILNNTKFNIFCSEPFLNQQSSEYGWIYNDLFLIPFYINRKYIFKSLVFTSDAISLVSSINEDEKQLFLDSIINEIPKLVKVDSILCPPSYVLFDHCPKGSKFCEFGSYRIDLSNSEDDLFSNLHSKHRNVIRKEQLKITNFSYDYIILSHLLNKDFLNRQSDFYFHELPQKLHYQGLKF